STTLRPCKTQLRAGLKPAPQRRHFFRLYRLSARRGFKGSLGPPFCRLPPRDPAARRGSLDGSAANGPGATPRWVPRPESSKGVSGCRAAKESLIRCVPWRARLRKASERGTALAVQRRTDS